MSVELTLELIMAATALAALFVSVATILIKNARRDGVIEERLRGFEKQLGSRRDETKTLQKEMHDLRLAIGTLTSVLRAKGHLDKE